MQPTIETLRKAIQEYNSGLALKTAQEIVDQKIDPLVAINAMTETIREIGEAFGQGKLWLPDLVGASDAMQAALPVLDEEIQRRGEHRDTRGVVIVGAVFGDIHSIGKTMVAALLTASGFQVEDLGVNIQSEQFIEAIKSHNADILAMSALMTTTIAEQKKVIEVLKETGLREKVKVMVGGAAVTEEFAKDIGADGYDPTAPGAVELAMKLIGK
ncbi:MAG: cobalamin-dependent protein [Spirochaetota bacterium]|nr:MAG: cobalamin-dependent protein [Spirochaetota bacterium]